MKKKKTPSLNSILSIDDSKGKSIVFDHPSQLTVIFTDKEGKPTLGMLMWSTTLEEAIRKHFEDHSEKDGFK